MMKVHNVLVNIFWRFFLCSDSIERVADSVGKTTDSLIGAEGRLGGGGARVCICFGAIGGTSVSDSS